ncbi:MAG: DUF4091 domain-containing protein [Clostridia bacterium]|nr:DUF4091 domain-containing protein [Clostridia bacterium]
MKKLLTLALTAAMLLPSVPAVFAESLTLAKGSHLVLDPESKYIDGIDGTITVGELKANFAGNVDIAGKADDAAVATDDMIGDYKALIYGDVNRDGKITLGDVSGILQNVAGWTTDVNTDAADVDKTGKINLADITKVLKHIAGWDDISLGNVRMIFENAAVTAENEAKDLHLFFTSMMNKLGVTQTDHTGEYSYKIKLAKNETESCQALLVSDIAREGLIAELTDFVYEYGDAVIESKLEWVNYYPESSLFTQVLPWNVQNANEAALQDDFPEVLLPMSDSFELKAERMQHFVISAVSGKDSPAGMYKAQLIIKDAEGKEIKTADVYAYVWDFALPDTPYSASLFKTAAYTTVTESFYPDYFEFMLQQNLSAYNLPVSILSDEADAYMSDPRVTNFIIDGFSGPYTGDLSDEDTIAAYAKVKSNPDWFKKGLFYYVDEPYASGLSLVKERYEYLANLLGISDISEVRNLTPFSNSWPDDEHQAKCIDAVEFIKPYTNVWVPLSPAYHKASEGGTWTPRYALSKYGEYADRIEEMRARGDETWWYVCNAPEAPYANYFTTYQGVINRLLSWQQYFNNVHGMLYYSTGEWWHSISKYNFEIGTGDGTLLYPGEFWGRTGPCASWRLYQIRDGFDDIDYLSMAEEIVGREAVMKIVSKVSSGMLNYTEDYRVLEECRDEIAKIILSAK